uniref:Alpha-macroglobulin receptor-binding domain-containing protein n=1 Tax=Anopheles atroparvus TaxID=41427 RepID=A0A182IZJ8_ANOAO
MRSLLVVCLVIFLNEPAVFADDGDACFILPTRIAPGKKSVDGIVANFGTSSVLVTVDNIGAEDESRVQKLLSCAHHAAFSVPTASSVPDQREILLQLNASFVNEGQVSPGKCNRSNVPREGNRVKRNYIAAEGSKAQDANKILLITQIPIVHQPRVLIQLSHPVYTPGDYVKYRILLTDGLIKPLDRTDSPLDVTVALQHHTQHTVGSWDVQLHPSEIYSGQYLLTDDRDLGDWNLTVTIGDQTTTKPFAVEQYSAPVHKIQVSVVDMAKNNLRLSVNAQYIFGKPIIGSMTVSLSGGDHPFNATETNFSGDKTLWIPMNAFLDESMDQPHVRAINVTVVVVTTNGVTQRTYRQTETIEVHPDQHKLTLHRMVGFVPGFNATLLVKLTRLNGKPILGGRQVTVVARLWDEDENRTIQRDTFKKTLELDGTAVLSVATTDLTTSVIFDVWYNSLEASFTLEYIYNPELFVRIIPTAYAMRRFDGKFKLGIASSHYLDGLVMVLRNQSGEAADEIIIDDKVTQTTYFESERGPLEGLKNVYLFAKVKDSETLVQTSVSYVEPQLPNQVNIEIEPVNGEHEITVTCSANFAVVGVAIYEGRLDWDYTDNINQYLMFNGTLYSNTDEFFAEYVNQLIITPSSRLESNVPDDMLLSEKPSTKFNQLLLWEQGKISPDEPDAKFKFKPPVHVNQLTVTAFTFSNTTGLDVAAPMQWERNNIIEIHLHVPYSAKKLEPVAVDVYVVNNRARRIGILLVELLNLANEFTFLNNSGRTDATRKTIYGKLESNEVQRAEFLIRPKKLGSIVLKAIAYTSDDVIATAETVLRAVPESELKTETINRPFTVLDSVASFSEKIPIPPTVDPGTEKISLVLHHEQNKMAVLSAKFLLDKLVQADPCTMAMKASLTLDVLRMAQMHWPERDAEATAMVNDSIGKIVRLAKPDGSIELGEYRQVPSSACWDTVVAVQALTFGHRHQGARGRRGRAIINALNWLKGRQATDGHFCGDEIVSVEQRVELTAHVLLAASSLETQQSWQYATLIDSARRYLHTALPELKDPYHLALVAFVAQFSDRIKTGAPSDSSIGTTVNTALQGLWVQKKSTPTQTYIWWSSASGRDLEATAYALLLLTNKKHLLEAAPLVSWIKRQPYKRAPLGITPDAHVALQALIAYAEQTNFRRQTYTATVVAKDRANEIYRATLQRNSTTHVLALPSTTRSVSFTINGTITGAVHMIYSYMESVTTQTSKFDIRIARYDESTADYVYWGICVRYMPKRALVRTRMVTCEIFFPTGYIALDDSVDELEELDEIASVILRNDETQLAITFEEITVAGRCFNVTGFRRTRATRLLPGTIKVFDITDPSDVAFKNFDVEH